MTEENEISVDGSSSDKIISHSISLREEAKQANERRLLVLAGDHETGIDLAQRVTNSVNIPADETTFVGSSQSTDWESVKPGDTDTLLGTTRSAIVFDAYDELFPNALGRVFGAVDGGGLFILLTPSLDEWPDRRDKYDASLAAPPYDVTDVPGHFKSRVVTKLREHAGITIFDVNSNTIRQDGHTNLISTVTETSNHAKSEKQTQVESTASETKFPETAYEACLTSDQADAVATFENLLKPNQAIVLEADRGRGKSSAAGIAAGVLAAQGQKVTVTGPGYRSAKEIFKRAKAVVTELGCLQSTKGPEDAPRCILSSGSTASGYPNHSVGPRGVVRFVKPAEVEEATTTDVLIVDEAAGFPVETLDQFLAAGRVAFTTTIHGYEGAGRGFSVRFKSRMEASELTVTEAEIDEPIRYADTDPVESFAYETLALNASPPPSDAVAGATTKNTTYREVPPEELVSDDELLEEVMGLLVSAHYRTEPNDLVRILDAPAVSVRGLFFNGHLVSVLYFAAEGDLSTEERTTLHEGERISGHLVPYILAAKLRDREAGSSPGVRLRRLTTHHTLHSIGLGSALVEQTHQEFHDEVDWFGAGFGTTPKLAYFWAEKGYDTVQFSNKRHEASGKYSVLMLRAASEKGERLRERHNRWFSHRIESKLSTTLRDMDPDVARPLLRTMTKSSPLGLSQHDWQVVADAAFGPVEPVNAPQAFRRLVRRYFVQCKSASEEGQSAIELSPQAERLLVSRILQGNGWEMVIEQTTYSSKSECKQALKDALQPLVSYYGGEPVQEAKQRFEE